MRVHTDPSSSCQKERREIDIPVPAAPMNLAAILWGRGHLPPRPLCAGIGHCGLCRVHFLSVPPAPTRREQDMLTPAELDSGVRLACCHDAEDSMSLAIPPEAIRPEKDKVRSGQTAADSPRPEDWAGTGAREARLAVDLGTTSIVWEALGARGETLAQGHQPNPQMGAGTDVMARLAAASPGEDTDGAIFMRDAVSKVLIGIADSLRSQGISVREICLAANPAMTLLALGLDASGLRAAPYRLDFHGAREAFLPGLPPLWIPPLPAPFVGGDLSAGICAVLHSSPAPRFPLLLADMGTNGEFVLLRAGLPPLLASVPLGPALEGIGLRCGGIAENGAVTAFHAAPSGLAVQTLGGTLPRRICGVGYLSLIRLLLDMGLLDTDGHFRPDASSPHPLAFLRTRLAASLTTERGEPVLPLPGDLFLAASDVESLLKVKAAFSLAVESLMAEAELAPADLGEIVLAGALGMHAPLDALADLGFLPPFSRAKTRTAGNTSLRGAGLLLCGSDGRSPRELRDEISALSANAITLPLAESPLFHERYIRHMRFGRISDVASPAGPCPPESSAATEQP